MEVGIVDNAVDLKATVKNVEYVYCPSHFLDNWQGGSSFDTYNTYMQFKELEWSC